MKYDPEKTTERLKGVPLENRVFIYDAAIIIEFLNQTLMPIKYFLSEKGEQEISGIDKFDPENFKSKDTLTEHRISIGTLYDYYKAFRQQRDYTAAMESRYKFQIILRKLNWAKNGWCFDVKRVGRAQLIYFAPMMLRVKVPKAERALYPPAKARIEETPVEVTPTDHNDDDIQIAEEHSFAEMEKKEEVKKANLQIEKLPDGKLIMSRGDGIPVTRTDVEVELKDEPIPEKMDRFVESIYEAEEEEEKRFITVDKEFFDELDIDIDVSATVEYIDKLKEAEENY